MLANALAARGRSALVLDDRADLHRASYYAPGKRRGSGAGGLPTGLAGHRGGGVDPDVLLVLVPDLGVTEQGAWDRLLLVVDVSREGTRHAYLQLKQLHMYDMDVPIGVTIVGAGNEHTARRCFDALAAGACHFLDLRLISYGWLSPAAAPEFAAGEGPEHCAAQREFLRVADLLLEDRRAVQDGEAPGADAARAQ